MADQDRPTKIRKLSHGESSVEQISTAQDQAQAQEVHLNEPVSTISSRDSNDALAEQLKGPEAENSIQEGAQNKKAPLPEEVAPVSAELPANDGSDPPLSKNQLKKLRKKAEWEAGREQRKVFRKEKLVAKRERKQAIRQQQIESGIVPVKPPRYPHAKPVQLPITFILDCDFDEFMHDGERISLASQLTRCYSDNKNAHFRAHITICSFGGKLRERFDTILNRNYESWRGVRAFDCDFVEAAEKAKEWMTTEKGGSMKGHFAKYADLDNEALTKLKHEGEVVYLTAEGDEDITELKPYSTYIIGGLVDKNREKGICYKRAKDRDVKTARLPIGQFMAMSSRKVLAVNHVSEIMLHWLETGDWGTAFLDVIPKRKGGTLKDAQSSVEAEDQAESEEDADSFTPGEQAEVVVGAAPT